MGASLQEALSESTSLVQATLNTARSMGEAAEDAQGHVLTLCSPKGAVSLRYDEDDQLATRAKAGI